MQTVCKSCGARITWIRMKSGKAMPCDAGAVPYRQVTAADAGGILTIVTADGNVVHGIRDECSNYIGYTSHFATCPNAAAHRKRA